MLEFHPIRAQKKAVVKATEPGLEFMEGIRILKRKSVLLGLVFPFEDSLFG
jgi:hypothetical protein